MAKVVIFWRNSIFSTFYICRYEYRLQQLMEQLHSIQDPDLLYRCADTLIEYDATAVTIDEYGQMDFDLYHVKKETVALLEEIFASLTPMSR